MKILVAALLLWTAVSIQAQTPAPPPPPPAGQVHAANAPGIDVPNELLFKPPQHLSNPKCFFIGVNDAGVAVGSVVAGVYTLNQYNSTDWSATMWHAIIWKAGKFTLLDGPLPTHGATYGVSINNRGQVLIYQDGGDGPHYFLYEPDLVYFRAVGTMGKVPTNPQPFRLSKITGINDKGEIAGYVENVAGVRGMPAMGAPGDVAQPATPAAYTAIVCPGKSFYFTGGINNQGDVAGVCDGGKTGFLAKANGAVSTFVNPNPRFIMNNGFGIDDADDIVGFSAMNGSDTGFLYRNGQFSTFGGLGIHGINNHGQIAGVLPVGRAHSSAFLTKLEP
jgi:hypothetical protein